MPAHPPRQVLATPLVGLAHEEEVVLLALLASLRFALVFAKLVVTQALKGLAVTARLLKDFLLLVAQCLKPPELSLQGEPLLLQILFTGNSKT